MVYDVTPKALRGDSPEDKKDSKDSTDPSDDKELVDRKRGEAFVYDYGTHLVDLMIFALGFASGWLLSAAVKAVLALTYEGVYDPDDVDTEADTTEYLLSIWGAFAIVLVVSTLIMTYLSKVVNAVRNER